MTMSFHRNDTLELRQALLTHAMNPDTPSQLADAFRTGFRYSRQIDPLLTQIETLRCTGGRVEFQRELLRLYELAKEHLARTPVPADPQLEHMRPAESVVERVTKAILFEDCGDTSDWKENTNLGEAAIRAMSEPRVEWPNGPDFPQTEEDHFFPTNWQFADALYSRGYRDARNERDEDPRGTEEWEAVVAAMNAPTPPAAPLGCTLGVGCDEAGKCYAKAHGQPDQCGLPES